MEKRLIELEVSRLLNKIINENESIIYEHFERGSISTFSSIVDGILAHPLFAVANAKSGKKKKDKKDKKSKNNKQNKNEDSKQQSGGNSGSSDNDNKKNIIVIMFSIGQSKNAAMYYLGSNDVTLINKKNKNNLLSIIDAKGGGKPGRLQGNANNLKNVSEFLNNLKQIVGDRAFVSNNTHNVTDASVTTGGIGLLNKAGSGDSGYVMNGNESKQQSKSREWTQVDTF